MNLPIINMKKISYLQTEDMSKLKSLQDEAMQSFANKYWALLNDVAEMYLGRPIDIDLDKGRLEIITGPDDIQHIFADGKEIGCLTQSMGYNNYDFINNKVSMSVTFTPLIQPTPQNYSPQ